MRYEDKIIILLSVFLIVSVGMNVLFMMRELKYMYEIEQFFSGCKAISREEIQCHAPREWNVINGGKE